MPKIITSLEIEELSSLYKSGLSSTSISKKTGLSKSSILKYLKLSNIESRKRIYNLNESYFNNIDSCQKSYLLGYLFADVCVRYNKESRIYGFKLKIHKRDIHILDLLKSELSCNNPINDEINNCVSLTISSKRIAEDLIKLGCIPNKSLVLEFPNINKKYYNSFIHGYFDGDGSIYYNFGQIHFKILGTNRFLSTISSILKTISIDYKVFRYDNSNIYCYRVTSKKSIKLIYDFFYSDNYICLDRKKDIFNKILEK